MASTLPQLREELAAKNAELHEVFVQAGDDMDMTKVTSLEGDTATKAAEIKRRNDVISELGEKIEAAAAEQAALAGIKANLTDPTAPPREGKKSAGVAVGPGVDTVGQPIFAPQGNPQAVKAMLEGSEKHADFVAGGGKYSDLLNVRRELGEISWADYKALKATLTLADITPTAERSPSILVSAQERFTVADLMLEGTLGAGRNTYSYMEETTFTNTAAETAEGIAKPEATLDLTERTETLRKIPVWIPATDEVLEDNTALESYIKGRLVFMVEQRREGQLLVGDGTAPNISGITDRSGIQTQAKGADPTPDAFYKAMVKVMTIGDADPTAHVINPLDWQDIRLLRTADGIYIWGSPSESGPNRLWGLPVRVTSAMTQNTGLTGAFTPFAQVFRKAGSGIKVLVSTEHASFFVENKVAILAEERLLLAVYRPAAFCTVTGI